MDRVLHVLGISVLDLIPRHVIERFAIANYDPEYETVPLVDASALHLPQPPNSVIHEHIKFKRSYLQRYRQGTTEDRKKWLRFVWMRTNETDVEAMYPRISHGSALLIDRHYTSLLPHSSADVSMYVVRTADRVVIRSFEVREREILLRAENPRVPIEFLPIDPKGRYTEKIIGRVCHVAYDAG